MNRAEFLFQQVAVTVFDHPEIRGWFLGLVRDTVFGQESRAAQLLPEFILYFAHVSRWPELAAIATDIQGRPEDPWHENPAITWSSELSLALGDAWQDREFYSGSLVHNVA
ncbi:hypothetical protein [Lysobacter sp. Root667]|uniref:hypothetical protein n=1 Tax=Lysobacter sp. Root667 TaxID=1736581 RepID=UPI0012DEB8F6|nr:hypothetical protein [Lysobacter sp. Root667]